MRSARFETMSRRAGNEVVGDRRDDVAFEPFPMKIIHHRRSVLDATQRLLSRMMVVVILLMAIPAESAETVLDCRFDTGLVAETGQQPLSSQGVELVKGREGMAARIDRPARLTYPTKGFNPDAFTISFWVRHEKPLEDYFYRRLSYFYHETPDMKNRIGILKRAGTNYFVFFFSNNEGRAKGENMADDWFAMTSPPMHWKAGTWHHIVCTADKSKGVAQFFIDGKKVAEAQGKQFPERLGEAFWVGTQGHSWMRGAIDELRIEPAARLDDSPVVQRAATPPKPLPPATRIMGGSVGELSGKEMTANLDFFDICIGTDTWDMRHCDAEMDRLMALCAHFGFDRVYFRVSVCGVVCYDTNVMTPALEESFQRYTVEGLDGCCANIPSRHRRMAEVMKHIDPLASCVKHGHKHGLEVYAWVTVYDSMYYATEQEFFQQHPEYTWVSKDGTKHIPGVPCYAYPEVREYRLAQVKELLEYGVDGIKFSPRSHSPWPGRGAGGGNEGARGYGFNQPVVEEYVRRFGKNPREAEPDSLDELRFVQLKADFFTEFMRETKQLTESAGKKLVMTTSTGVADPVRANWMYVDAETLARERLVDELSIMGSSRTNLNHWRLLADGRIKMTTWSSIHGYTYDECLGKMRSQLRALLENPTSDGSSYHELANLVYPDCWEEGIVDTVEAWQATREDAASSN